MIVGVIMLILIAIVIIVLNYKRDGNLDSPGVFFGFIILLTTSVGIIIYNHKSTPVVDLPEEAIEMSTDVNKPDTLLGYRNEIDGIYYIMYKN